ncbi:MAG: hypothetical protein IPK16_07110 [Anaerolineales bacterium]|nr:hypothetical protein [Anaerolineales bacterium]
MTGLEVGLKLKFGDAGLALLPTISQITDPDILERLLHTLVDCNSLADFERAIPQV